MYLHSMPPDFEPPPEFIIVCNAVRNCFREKKRALRRFCQLFCCKNVRRATNFNTFVLQIILQLCCKLYYNCATNYITIVLQCSCNGIYSPEATLVRVCSDSVTRAKDLLTSMYNVYGHKYAL